MASDDEKRVKAKKEKKEKRRSETDGVHKSKKDKKEKKAKDDKLKKKIATALEEQLEADAASASAIVKKSKKAAADIESEDDHPGSDFEEIKNAAIETALVYFALPIADAKGHKKIYKTIKKGMSTTLTYLYSQMHNIANVIVVQHEKPAPSSVASRKSTRPCARPLSRRPQARPPCRESPSLPAISHPTRSLCTCRCTVRSITSPTCSSPRGWSSAPPPRRSALPVLSS